MYCMICYKNNQRIEMEKLQRTTTKTGSIRIYECPICKTKAEIKYYNLPKT